MAARSSAQLSADAAAYVAALAAALNPKVPPAGRERADALMRELGTGMRTGRCEPDHARAGSIGEAICQALEHRIFDL